MARMRRGLVLLVVVAAVFILWACGPASTPSTPPAGEDAQEAGGEPGPAEPSGGEPAVMTIDIAVTQYPAQLFAVPYVVGMEKGIFREEGIEIRNVVPGRGGATTLRNVLAGDLPFGEVATAAIVNGYQNGAPVVVVGGAGRSVGEMVYVTRKGEPIRSLADMKGRKFAYTNPGSVTEAVAILLVQAHPDLELTDVEFVATGGVGEGLTVLEAGGVDLAVLPDPIYAMRKDSFQYVLRASDYIPEFQQTLIISNPAFIRDHPDVVRGFLRAYDRSLRYTIENPEEAGQLWAQVADIEVAAAVEAVQAAIDVHWWDLAISPAGLEAVEESLRVTGSLGEDETVPWSEFVNQEFLPDDKVVELPQ